MSKPKEKPTEYLTTVELIRQSKTLNEQKKTFAVSMIGRLAAGELPAAKFDHSETNLKKMFIWRESAPGFFFWDDIFRAIQN